MKKLLAIVFLLFVVCFTLVGQEMKPGACEQKAKLLLDKVLELWNKGNYALIPELYTVDAVATSSSTPVTFVGHEGIKKWIENSRVMMPDLVMAFPEIVAQRDKIVTVWTMTGTQNGPMVMPGGTLPPTGRKVSVTGLSIDYLKDGKMAKEVVIFNALEMLMQLGFTLAPPQAPPPAQK